MKVCVYGAGANGGDLGAQLAHAGAIEFSMQERRSRRMWE
jgi:ketopantoate reductase